MDNFPSKSECKPWCMTVRNCKTTTDSISNFQEILDDDFQHIVLRGGMMHQTDGRWRKNFLLEISLIASHLSQTMNGTSSNSIARIEFHNSPEVFGPELVFLHALVKKSTLYEDWYIWVIMLQHLHKIMQPMSLFYPEGQCNANEMMPQHKNEGTIA